MLEMPLKIQLFQIAQDQLKGFTIGTKFKAYSLTHLRISSTKRPKYRKLPQKSYLKRKKRKREEKKGRRRNR